MEGEGIDAKLNSEGIMYFTPVLKQKRLPALQNLDFSGINNEIITIILGNAIESQGFWMIVFCLVEGEMNEKIETLKFSRMDCCLVLWWIDNSIGDSGISHVSHIFQISSFKELVELDLSRMNIKESERMNR